MSKFYFTMHPGDMIAGRILDGASIMLVASAHWNNDRRRFRIARPPANVGSIAVDSGGFTAARRWGRYPWSVQQYADFIQAVSRDAVLDFCAILDYACEREVNRSALATNRARIKATIRNEAECRESAPGLPWLPVLQGNTLDERGFDLGLRARIGLTPGDYAGIGSVCGRSATEARAVVKFYADRLPVTHFHGFGIHVQALDDDVVFARVKSWDSYGWAWGRGQKDVNRPAECYHRPPERYTDYTRRLAQFYWDNTVSPRLNAARQLVLF